MSKAVATASVQTGYRIVNGENRVASFGLRVASDKLGVVGQWF